jgi:hypothetical protein
MFGTTLQRMKFYRKIKTFIKVALPIVIVGLVINAYLKNIGLQLPTKRLSDEHKVVSNSYTKIHNLIIAGDYDEAIALIKANPDDINLKKLYSQLTQELTIDFKFHYLPNRKWLNTADTSDNLILTSKDPYYLTVHASDYCYLYIFQLSSSGDIRQLFPSNKVPTTNPIPPGKLRIPDVPYWLYPDDVSGIEQIYLVATRWRHENLEELIAKLNAERNPIFKRKLIDKIILRLQHEDKSTDRIGGLVFGMYEFKVVPTGE